MLQTADTGFDPFLRQAPDAEVVSSSDGIGRALAFLMGREVMIGGPTGSLHVGRLVSPLAIQFERACDLRLGDEVAVSDHRGFRYVGFRSVVGAIFLDEAGRYTARLFEPKRAIFYPGRQRLRVDGVLGATVAMEYDDAVIPARGLDLSLAGVGLLVDAGEGFAMGQGFILHLHFGDESISVPALVRSATVVGDGVRLGVEFVAHSEALALRFHHAVHAARAS